VLPPFQTAVEKACKAEKGENEREHNDALRALITTDPKLVNRG
jgi:hypothetical protein